MGKGKGKNYTIVKGKMSRLCTGCAKTRQIAFVSKKRSGQCLCNSCRWSHRFCRDCDEVYKYKMKWGNYLYCKTCKEYRNYSCIPVEGECFKCNMVALVKPFICDVMLCSECHDRESRRIITNCKLDSKSCLKKDLRIYRREGEYDGYIDGVGFMRKQPRWAWYCPYCKDWYAKCYQSILMSKADP